MSKTVQEKTYVCQYLIGLKPTDVVGPLEQFQLTKTDEEDTFRLVASMNRALGEQALPEEKIKASFKKWWPDLEQLLKKMPAPAKDVPKPRDVKDLQEETLEIVRRMDNRLNMLVRPRGVTLGQGLGFPMLGPMAGGTYGLVPSSGPVVVVPTGTVEATGSSPETKTSSEGTDKK